MEMKTFPIISFTVTVICIFPALSGLRPPQAIKDSVCGQCRVAGRKCYDTGQDWCCMCPAGHYLSAPCRLHHPETTSCTPCETQTYMPDGNNETSCIKSKVSCDELPYTALEYGNTTRDNRCACIAGTFSSTDSGDSGGCKPHLKCPEGFGVIKYGNSTHDAECGRCRDDTFSNLTSSTRKCQPFRKCQNDEKVTFAGNSKRNRECSTIVSGTDVKPPVTTSSDAATTSQPAVWTTDALSLPVEENGTVNGLLAAIFILVLLMTAFIIFVLCCCKRKKDPKFCPKGLNKHHDDNPKSEDEKLELELLVLKSQNDSKHDKDISGGSSSQNGSYLGREDEMESPGSPEYEKEETLHVVFDESKASEEPLQALPHESESPELKKKAVPVFGEFEKNFQSKGFRVIYDPKKDGNCQFNAAAKFLHADHRRLRRAVVAELERNEHQYSEFIDTDRYANYGEYVKQMSKEGEYGDHLTLKIISKLYNVIFTIIQTSNDTPITINESNGPTADMYILGHISEDDGMHYVCLESLGRGAEQDMESSSARQPSSDARLGDDASTSAAATSVQRDGAVEEARHAPREPVSQRSGDVSQGTRETGHEVFDEPKEFEEPLQALPDVNESPELKKKHAPAFGEFEKNFQSKGFRVIYDPKEDGNCQFNAAAKFLHADHRRLRRAVVAELERNEHQYSEFIDTDRYANYGEYVKQMSKEGEYGDHLTLKIISKLSNVVFTIIQTSNDTPITINESNGPTADMYILGHISEDDGMHYVCLESLGHGAEQDMESSSARQPSSDARLGDDASTSAAATSVQRDGAVEEARRAPREPVSQRSGDVSQGTRETGHEVFDEPKEFEEPLQALPDVNESPELKKKHAPVFGEFEKNFQSKGFRVIYDPKKDGNCQFNAAAKFLHTDHRRLRRAVVAELEQNEHQYSEFIDTDRYANYGEYVKQMSKEGEYGDHLTLKIISKLSNVVFTIIQTSNDTPITINESNGPTADMYILGHISEDDGMHYVCLESLGHRAEQDMESSSARQPSSDARLGDDVSTSAAVTSVQRDGAVEEAQRTPREPVSQGSGDVSQGTRETGHESSSNAYLSSGNADEQNIDGSSSQSCESSESSAGVPRAADQSAVGLDRHSVPISTHETQQNGPDLSRQSPEINTHETLQHNGPRAPNQPTERAIRVSDEYSRSSVGCSQDSAVNRGMLAAGVENDTSPQNVNNGAVPEMAHELFDVQADIDRISQVPGGKFETELESWHTGKEMLMGLRDMSSDCLKNFIRECPLLLEIEIEDIILECGSKQSEMRRKLLRKIIEKKGRELTPRFLLRISKEYKIRIIYDTLCKAFIESIMQ